MRQQSEESLPLDELVSIKFSIELTNPRIHHGQVSTQTIPTSRARLFVISTPILPRSCPYPSSTRLADKGSASTCDVGAVLNKCPVVSVRESGKITAGSRYRKGFSSGQVIRTSSASEPITAILYVNLWQIRLVGCENSPFLVSQTTVSLPSICFSSFEELGSISKGLIESTGTTS